LGVLDYSKNHRLAHSGRYHVHDYVTHLLSDFEKKHKCIAFIFAAFLKAELPFNIRVSNPEL